MKIHKIIDCDTARLALSGNFSFHTCLEFKKIYSVLLDNHDINRIEIDLKEIRFLDSSALGSLILLNEQARCNKKIIALQNPSVTALRVLEMANFHKIFTILHAIPTGFKN